MILRCAEARTTKNLLSEDMGKSMKKRISTLGRSVVGILLAVVTAVSVGTIVGVGKTPVNTTALAEKMVTSKYALDMSKTDYVSGENGLRNPYIVGIDGEKFENEVKYAPAEDAHVIEVKAPEYEFQDSTADVQNALNRAAEYQRENAGAEVVIKFPAGKLYFYQGAYDSSLDDSFAPDENIYDDGMNGRYAVFLSGRKNLTFMGATDGEGNLTTECLLFGQNGFHFMKISDCENIKLCNLQLDYADLPYYFGEVVEKRDNFTLRIKTWADYPVENTNIEVYLEYDKDTACMREAANNTYNASNGQGILEVSYVNGDHHLIDIRFANKIATTPVGTKVAMSTMKTAGSQFTVKGSKNIYFETVYLYCAGGSAIEGFSNENLYFNRLMAVLKPNTDRLLGVAGDVIHVENTKGDFVLTNSQIENTQDDGINVCGHYMYPYNVNSNKNSAVLLYRGSTDATYECDKGDVLAMMNTSTMQVVGYYKVKGVTIDQACRYVVTFEQGGTATLPSGETVELESDVSKIGSQSDSIFSNITRAPVVLVENTVMRNKRNRGLLIQSRNVTIRNCEFSNVVNTAVMLLGEMASFCESTLPRDVTIQNCKFINCDDNDVQIAAYNNVSAAGDAGAIQNVTLDNNLFAYQQNAYSIYLTSISGLHMTDNWFYKPQTGTQKVNFDTAAIMLRNCSDIEFDGNLLSKFLPVRDGIFVWEGVDIQSFDWGDNTGFERKDVFGEMQAQSIAKLSSAITVDGNIADWLKLAATEIAIDNVTNVHIQKLDFESIPTADFSATVKTFVKLSDGDTFAADDGIYFYFNVVDDNVHFERSMWWGGDCFEFYLSSDTTSYDEIGVIKDNDGVETLQLAMKGDVDGNDAPCIYPGRTTTSICDQLTLSTATANADYLGGGIRTAFALTQKGYRGEAFIPFSLFKVCGNKLKAGEEIAMAFCFIDSTEEGQDEILSESMTFSNVLHPTCTANKVPATMVKFKLA